MKKLKNVILLLIYWVIFIMLPCFIVSNIIKQLYSNHAQNDQTLFYIYLYLILITPILSIIPYKMAKFKNKTEKYIFIALNLIAPYVGIYLTFMLNNIPFTSGPSF